MFSFYNTVTTIVFTKYMYIMLKFVFRDDFTKSFEPIYKHQIISCISCHNVEGMLLMEII